jgi:flagellar FliJ protein
MSFPLAGLLRVRGAQERVAAESLSHASAERLRAESAERGASRALQSISVEITDGSTLLAMAAARAASNTALSDLRALTELRRTDELDAKATHVEARRELKGLERLETSYQAQTEKAELAAEQNALDEIAIARIARRRGGAE